MIPFSNIYQNRKVLITGHTGFKGSWLTLWLQQLGAKISGISLPETAGMSHWNHLDLAIKNHLFDIRDYSLVSDTFRKEEPEIIFHLAAQPLVRESYKNPLLTWSTNVMGTANILEACRQTSSVKAIVVITTDKCYQNHEWVWSYRENDSLGGYDPYSASKAAVEILCESHRKSFCTEPHSPLLATARAGNVIGGGDWSPDRIIPDIIRAVQKEEVLIIRSPQAVRPWQHVLESLSGYLMLGQKLLEGDTLKAQAWNFGPSDQDHRSVEEVLCLISKFWPVIKWEINKLPQPHEAGLLRINCEKARQSLRWRPVWDLQEALHSTIQWYREYIESGHIASLHQLNRYIEDAQKSGARWLTPDLAK